MSGSSSVGKQAQREAGRPKLRATHMRWAKLRASEIASNQHFAPVLRAAKEVRSQDLTRNQYLCAAKIERRQPPVVAAVSRRCAQCVSP